MKNTKLIELLKTFSKEEMKEFEKFVASPYFSRGRDLMPFLKILKTFYPEFSNSGFNYEKIYKKLNPKLKYSKANSENAMRVMSSDLFKLAEEFMIYEKINLNNMWRRYCLIDAYFGKDLSKMYNKLHSETQKDLVKFAEYGFTSRYFVEMYYLKMFDVGFAIYNNRLYPSTIESQTALMNFFLLCATNFIDNSYKLKLNYNIDNKDDLAEQFMQCFNFEKFILYLKKNEEIKKEDKEILELCFYHLLHVLDRDNEEYISILERLFYKNRHLFHNEVKLSFYFQLIPVYDKNNDLDKLCTLYKNILEDKIYEPEVGMKMSFVLYFNILYLFAEKLPGEAENFALKYYKNLNTDKEESFYDFSFALIEFKRKNYDKSLEYISKVEITFHYLKYISKILYLQIYFELNYTEEANFMIDSFKHFLKANQHVPDKLGINFKKFTDYYKKLLNIKTSGKRSELRNLYKSISNEKRLFYKSWLLEKIDEL